VVDCAGDADGVAVTVTVAAAEEGVADEVDTAGVVLDGASGRLSEPHAESRTASAAVDASRGDVFTPSVDGTHTATDPKFAHLESAPTALARDRHLLLAWRPVSRSGQHAPAA